MEKGVDRPVQPVSQVAGRENHTVMRDGHVVATHDGKILLGDTDDFAHRDLLGRARQAGAASTAARRFDEAGATELVDDFRQVIARNSVVTRDFIDRRNAAVRVSQSQVHHDPKRVIGVDGEVHGDSIPEAVQRGRARSRSASSRI